MYIHTTGLGCAFLNERCTNHSVFPYLCDTRDTQLICTYDHLTKVRTVCMYRHWHEFTSDMIGYLLYWMDWF